jgi:signal peptidase II
MSADTQPSFLRLGLLVAGTIFIIDQMTKWWIVFDVMAPPKTIAVFPSFNLVMGWNRGISFGMFDGDSPLNKWLLIILALTVVTVLLVWLKRAENRLVGFALGLIIGGAFGNITDRIHFGAVADFLDFYIGAYHWPAFNVADAGITVGAVVLVLDSLIRGAEQNNMDSNKYNADENNE